MGIREVLTLPALAALVLAPASPASAAAGPVSTAVARSTAGVPADAAVAAPSISGDGRYVVFSSAAGNLVPGDTNGVPDVFLRDVVAGTTGRVSVSANGQQGSGASADPVISADGRFVAFGSAAGDLVPGDTNGVSDVFVRDLVAGTTERVSVSSTGQQAGGASTNPAISADGHAVAFYSDAANLVAGDTNAGRDVFVRDRATGDTVRADVSATGQQANRPIPATFRQPPAISADGSRVAFLSAAGDLVPGDTNNSIDLFVRDLPAGTTVRASVADGGAQVSGVFNVLSTARVSLSGDGRRVAFSSTAPSLVAGDTDGVEDVFVHDLDKRTTIAVTAATPDAGRDPSLSADGTRVAYETAVGGTSLGAAVLRDLTTGVTTYLSVRPSSVDPGRMLIGPGRGAALSAGGHHAALLSEWDLDGGPTTNNLAKAFVRGPLA